jgi:hypothetical protein
LINNTATGHFQKDDLRGFTGHEQLPRYNIINMNARLYDPLTARFLSERYFHHRVLPRLLLLQ